MIDYRQILKERQSSRIVMPLLQEWLSANRPLILLVYGQVFFVMGIAILLPSRR